MHRRQRQLYRLGEIDHEQQTLRRFGREIEPDEIVVDPVGLDLRRGARIGKCVDIVPPNAIRPIR
ncbi:hypothetical protein C7I55_17500 [Sphingomonas deserti]|uniref:Uncharacterized protein n=1 Tax=Allosphingosinicella deserti TaxID=2116704 RepID=A0A2P7QM96_9SPHN|nr:hypothetical protein C7I55_17500 [Sphingomonas deserti]